MRLFEKLKISQIYSRVKKKNAYLAAFMSGPTERSTRFARYALPDR